MSGIRKEVLFGTYKHVWIYGAGRTGRKLYKDFCFLHIHTDGFVLSSRDGTVVPGAQVRGLSEVKTQPADTLFIITASEKFHNEIIENIKKHGFWHYLMWDAACLCELWRQADYDFTDRRTFQEKCCFILAGYKEFLWKDVFERLARFMPEDVDACIVSSGIYSEKLAETAARNGWSYLSTKINSVTLAQNTAYSVFEQYEWIYKVDEDMFVTRGVFEKLFEAYQDVEHNSRYLPGMATPLIPVNGYGYRKILEKIGRTDDYERTFGKIKIGGNPDSEIEKNPETAVYMWRECPQIDELNKMFADEKQHDFCSVRLSIGFILFRRSLWEGMHGFSVSGNTDMGTDEEELCAQCMNQSKAIIICGRSAAGHFAFGRQTDRMKQFYARHAEWFKICE